MNRTLADFGNDRFSSDLEFVMDEYVGRFAFAFRRFGVRPIVLAR